MDSNKHYICLNSGKIPEMMICFYVEQLKMNKVFHPKFDELKELSRKLINDEHIELDDYCIEDPIILMLLTTLEHNHSFDEVIKSLNRKCSNFTKERSPKILKNGEPDAMNIARKYCQLSPEKLCKSGSEDNIIMIRRNSNAKMPTPKIFSNQKF